jgi:hypothetical protein
VALGRGVKACLLLLSSNDIGQMLPGPPPGGRLEAANDEDNNIQTASSTDRVVALIQNRAREVGLALLDLSESKVWWHACNCLRGLRLPDCNGGLYDLVIRRPVETKLSETPS